MSLAHDVSRLPQLAATAMGVVLGIGGSGTVAAEAADTLAVGSAKAVIAVQHDGDTRSYQLTTTAELRDHKPADKQLTFSEHPEHATVRSGNLLFDGLYALAVSEARLNSVSQISDFGYAKGAPIQLEAFQTGEFWKYVWTRDLSYSLHLGLANFDPGRAISSLLFKSSLLKQSVKGGLKSQIIQDTGSGGSYPVSTDRVIWALGAHETLKNLRGPERQKFLEEVYPLLCDTAEQDRRLVFDPHDGLYRGEQSFLDWREQTYPGWTKDNVLAIAMSKALSTNAAHYFLLRTAAEYSGRMNRSAEQERYAGWAEELKLAINRGFYDEKAGLYSAYLLSDDGTHAIPVHRYDLLGHALAILFNVADPKQASSILSKYPTGPHGPPVVWPQEATAPIYHNQGIWPFVTAYWIKAARQARNSAAVDAGILSLYRLAAVNLSNMENFDFVSGLAEVKSGRRKGPEVNSRRQLWSVAAYLSMVQDVVFGFETSWDGIRFQPFVTARLRNETFGSSDTLELRNLNYQGSRNRVRVHLPPVNSFADGACAIDRVELNGKPVVGEFVKADMLQPTNDWEVFLRSPVRQDSPATIRVADVSDERALCGPPQPRWSNEGQGGMSVQDGRLVLSFSHEAPSDVAFNVYRDGQLCAGGIRTPKWTDADSADYRNVVRSYAVEAVDLRTGNVSHLTPARSFRAPDQQQVIRPDAMQSRGGNLVNKHHFENWGKPDDEISTDPFTVRRSGRYDIRAEFSNGAGPVNTGIACAVKKLEIRNASSPEVIASGYLVMPQSGDWKRFDMSSAIPAQLEAGQSYVMRVCEDEYCRNMSFLKNNERYSASAGGGDSSYNYVNFSALHVLLVSAL